MPGDVWLWLKGWWRYWYCCIASGCWDDNNNLCAIKVALCWYNFQTGSIIEDLPVKEKKNSFYFLYLHFNFFFKWIIMFFSKSVAKIEQLLNNALSISMDIVCISPFSTQRRFSIHSICNLLINADASYHLDWLSECKNITSQQTLEEKLVATSREISNFLRSS